MPYNKKTTNFKNLPAYQTGMGLNTRTNPDMSMGTGIMTDTGEDIEEPEVAYPFPSEPKQPGTWSGGSEVSREGPTYANLKTFKSSGQYAPGQGPNTTFPDYTNQGSDAMTNPTDSPWKNPLPDIAAGTQIDPKATADIPELPMDYTAADTTQTSQTFAEPETGAERGLPRDPTGVPYEELFKEDEVTTSDVVVDEGVGTEETFAADEVSTDTYDTTDMGGDARDEYAKYAMGTDPMVEAERKRLERDNVLRLNQMKREAHERAVREGYMPGTPQYEQYLRNAISDAEHQNINATNAFHDFERQRRSDKQAELSTIYESEYEKNREGDQDRFRRFEDVAKYLPSDKAQQVAMSQYLGGADIGAIFQGMYDSEGNLKSEYDDMNRAELVKEGIRQAVEEMENDPATGVAWTGDAKEKYINTFYQENFENILYPSEQQSDQRTEAQEQQSRIDSFLKTGDASTLLESDWGKMSSTDLDKAADAGHIDKLGTTTKPRTIGQFNETGLKADYVGEATQWESDDRQDFKKADSAGEGKGSIVVYQGKPYRVISFITLKDRSGTDERNGTMILTPLDGSGDDVEIKSGFRNI